MIPVLALWAVFGGGAAHAVGLPPAAPGDLTISEFMAELDTVPAYYGEWIELHNNTDHDIDLFGLTINGSADDEGIEIDESVVVAPGGYVLLGVDADPSRNGNIEPDYIYDFARLSMDHTEDTLQIAYEGLAIDTVSWTSSSWDVVKQHSEQLNVYMIGLEWANDLPQSWCQSRALYGAESWYGSPGLANGICDGSNNDADGDGYSEATGDCNDLDPAVNPEATDGNTSPDGEPDDDADCDGVRDDGAIDDDGDGYAEVNGDCDDADSSVSPGIAEVTNGIDDDCDGCVDDLDNDGDGWTTCDTGAVVDCNADDAITCTLSLMSARDYVEGSCAFALDCDDSDEAIQPCAPETAYDAVDQSCDSLDRCDQDADGYNADPSACVGGVDCCADPRTGAPGTDCDDLNRDVNPAEAEGDPDQGGIPDGVDNDCNGVVDDPYLDADGDGYTAAEGDCVDAADDPAAASQNPGQAEICGDGLDNDCDGLFDDGCVDDALFATVSGGSLFCGTAGPGASLGAAAIGLLALVRRRQGGAR